MKVKIQLLVDIEELEEMQESFKELNGKELSICDAADIFTDMFITDHTDYLDPDRIEVYFK